MKRIRRRMLHASSGKVKVDLTMKVQKCEMMGVNELGLVWSMKILDIRKKP